MRALNPSSITSTSPKLYQAYSKVRRVRTFSFILFLLSSIINNSLKRTYCLLTEHIDGTVQTMRSSFTFSSSLPSPLQIPYPIIQSILLLSLENMSGIEVSSILLCFLFLHLLSHRNLLYRPLRRCFPLSP